MNLKCKNFYFNGQSLSDLVDYAIVGLESDTDDIMLGLTRSIERGNRNPYRDEPNHFGTILNDYLTFDLPIMKNPCKFSTQTDLEFSREDITSLTSWLMSKKLPTWMETDNSDIEDTRYKGVFTNVTPYVVQGRIYGLTFTFECSTNHAFSNEKTSSITTLKLGNTTVINNSDRTNDYIYPTIEIKPNSASDIFIANLTDATILQEGKIVVNSSSVTMMNSLKTKISQYALEKGLSTSDLNESGSTFCDSTAIQFTLKNTKDEITKCFAYYDSVGNYKMLKNGMMRFKVQKSNPIYMNCQTLQIKDSLDRMIQYETLGITDVDQIYWLRLLHGANDIICWCSSATIKFTYNEIRECAWS